MRLNDSHENHISIVGTGYYVPNHIMTNSDWERLVDTTDDWIVSRTGIRKRHIANASEAASDLALQAASLAIERSEIVIEEIDVVIVATQSPDYPLPSTACVLQHKLGLRNAVGFDMSASCSGFVFALIMAESLLRNSSMKTALVIGVDIFSRLTDWEDRTTSVLFGDGAGAVVLQKSNRGLKIMAHDWGSDGAYANVLQIPAGGSRLPLTQKRENYNKLQYLKMDGKKVYKLAVNKMSESVNRALDNIALQSKDIDLLIPHQANQRIIEALADALNVLPNKVISNVERFGNTAAASVPIALDEALKGGRVKDHDLVVLTACGAGLTWGSVVLR